MKKVLMKVLVAVLLVAVLASSNGFYVLAEGVAEEIQKTAESEEEGESFSDEVVSEEQMFDSQDFVAEDEISESEDNTSEETIREDVPADESTLEEAIGEELTSEESEEPATEDMVVEEEEIPVDVQGANIVHSGTWGDSVTWTLDEEGVLTVTQAEEIAYEYFEDIAPWSEYAENVKKLVWGANCLKKSGDAVRSAISFGNIKWNSSMQRYANDYPNLEEIEFTEKVSMEYITDMSAMFRGCSSLTSLDISGFETGNVTNMVYMFSNCSSLTSLDLSGLNTSNVTNMYYMFFDCSSLTSLDLSGLNTSNVTNMYYMFSDCSSLTSLDLSGFETGNVTNMSHMFSDCSSLTGLDISDFKTSNVTDMSFMFYGCSSLKSLDLKEFDTKKVTSMSSMFNRCRSLTSLDVSGFDTGSVTTMLYMFSECESLTSLDLSAFETGSVESMGLMFYKCENLASLDVSGFDTSNVTDMVSMYRDCESLTSLNVSGFDTSKVTSMGYMFKGCSSLVNLDVSGFDTTNVKDMNAMFSFCSSLVQLDLSNFDTQSVTDMNAMFFADVNLKSVTFGDIQTGNVTDMKNMFYDCRSLAELNVSGFDTAKVTLMDNMFSGCFALKELDLSGFNTESITSMTNFLQDCNNLQKIHTIPNLLIEKVELPSGEEFSDWHVLEDEEAVAYLPTELQGSVILVRDYINFENEVIEIASLAFSKEEYTLITGRAMQLTPIIEPENATDKSLYWTCVGTSMLNTVDQSGTVFGLEPGEVIVTVYAVSNPNVSASCKVIIKEQENELKVTFDCIMDGEEYIIYKGNSVTPKLQWIGQNDWEELTYEVANNTAEFVNGKLVAKETGSGTLTVRARSGSQIGPEAVVKYRVCEAPSGISFNTQEVFFDVNNFEKREFILEAEVTNKDESFNKIEFSISGNDNFILTDNGDNTATIKYEGTQTATATVVAKVLGQDKVSAKCIVKAGNPVSDIIIKSSLNMNYGDMYFIRVGETAQLNAVITPSNASVKTVKWESENPEMLSVSEDGEITALKPGATKIYAYATDGSGIKAERIINVSVPFKSFELKVVKRYYGSNHIPEFFEDNIIPLYENDENVRYPIRGIYYDADGREMSDEEYYYTGRELDYKLSKGAKAEIISHELCIYKAGQITIKARALDGSNIKSSAEILMEQRVYKLDANAPKGMTEYEKDGKKYWQMPSSSKVKTLHPGMTYNDPDKKPDKKWQKYTIVLSDEAAEVMEVDSKGTGIVLKANIPEGDYEIKFRTSDGTRDVEETVVIRISDAVHQTEMIWPANMISDCAEKQIAAGSKITLTPKVNGVSKNSVYKYEWKLDGSNTNHGFGTVSAKGVLDLKKAEAGDSYMVSLIVKNKSGDTLDNIQQTISIAPRMNIKEMKLMVGNDEVLPSVVETCYAQTGKRVWVNFPQESAGLYQITGGKTGVLRIENTNSGYMLYTDTIGTAKVTVKAMDGSNLKKTFTIKVKKSSALVAEFIVPKGEIETSGGGSSSDPAYIYYRLRTKDGGIPDDCRVKWEFTSSNKKLIVGGKVTRVTSEASGWTYLFGTNIGQTGKVKVKATTLDGSKKTISLTITVKRDKDNRGGIKFLGIQPVDNVPYHLGYREPLLVHGKTMRMNPICNDEKFDKKRVQYILSGIDENGNEIISQDELKKLGITIKDGVLKASSTSSYTGRIQIKAGYPHSGWIEPTEWKSCVIRIMSPVTKVSIQNTDGETITKVNAAPGESISFKANVSGKKDVLEVYQGITWTVSDKKYASMNEYGVVTIAENTPKNKKIKVTATAQDGSGKKATVTITVK